MRIAQVAPFESVPPRLYGGTERVVSYLTEELVRLGHEVTLFASGDSHTAAKLVPVCPQALWQDESCKESLPHYVRLMELVFEDVSRFDVLHFHSDYLHFPFLRRHPCPSVTTLHGRLHVPDLLPLFEEYPEVPLVSIPRPSGGAAPGQLAGDGLPRFPRSCTPQRAHDYLAFLGRIPRQAGSGRLMPAGRRPAAADHPEERDYFQPRSSRLHESRAGRVHRRSRPSER
jgi:glycosyltransferase involved in cell wall biosynthesis